MHVVVGGMPAKLELSALDMTITAINPKQTGMMLMAEWHGLLQEVIGAGDPACVGQRIKARAGGAYA